MRIDLTDNSSSGPLRRKDIAALFPIAGKIIGQLCRENENLLIFPYNIAASDDRIGALPIMSMTMRV